jgi:hypothetical protein
MGLKKVKPALLPLAPTVGDIADSASSFSVRAGEII